MTANVHPLFERQFLPADLNPDGFADVEPFFQELLNRGLRSPAELEKWLRDFSELWSIVIDVGQHRCVAKSAQTDDAALEAAHLKYVEEFEPKIQPLAFQLEKRFLGSPHLAALTESDRRYRMLERRWLADVAIYRDENVPLETQVRMIVNEYEKTCGVMTATFRGVEQTLPQLSRFQEEPDRPTREAAWRTAAERRLQDRERIECYFDQLLPLRERIARNAGMPDYRAYCWQAQNRFDYTPDDCLRFADAIAQCVVPLVNEFDRQRRRDLSLEKLRPWDEAVDPKNRPPLRPFPQDRTDRLIDGAKDIFQRLSPRLAEEFETLRARGHLDLASRKGKNPGAGSTYFEELREPLIFMNAAGTQEDVTTLLHEAGHAFHWIAARSEPLVFLSIAPVEFLEVASMSMEALGADHFDVFYENPADAARAKRRYFENVIRFLPRVAMIDSFQHWIYTHPGHSRDERAGEWLRLLNRFFATPDNLDWTGLEEARASMWHRIEHLFFRPFYYIEYGIAQLGALQLWMKSKENPRQALANYRAALALGGTRPLPELFAAAGIRFDFSEKTLRPLINAVREELASLPE